MANSKIVTCSFQMNRDLYNQYKSIVVRNGRNVKEDIIKYMQNVIAADTPNAETLAAFKEGKTRENSTDGTFSLFV